MPLTPTSLLQKRAKKALRYLLREVHAITEEQAHLYASPHWESHKYGIGQNGSIAGIAYHVAAWKQLSLPLLKGENVDYTGDFTAIDFNAQGAPAQDDWQGIVRWLETVGEEWNTALHALTEADLDSLRPWEGDPIPLWEFVAEFIDHDLQHASQIEYLHQRMTAEAQTPEPTLLGPIPLDLLDYVRDLFAPEDAALRQMTESLRENSMPEGWEISRDVGQFFRLICRLIGAKRVIEFGTLAGHSAYWLAQALPEDGTVISIELNTEWAKVAQNNLNRAGVGEKVEIRLGAAQEMTGALAEEVARTGQKYDAIFLDAAKAHYPEFLVWAEEVLRPGGVLFADNVLRSDSWKGQTLLDPKSDDPRILAIRRFNQMLAEHPRFTGTIVPLRAGVAMGVYHGK
jgi:predicted O-methyltransferase YrrM